MLREYYSILVQKKRKKTPEENLSQSKNKEEKARKARNKGSTLSRTHEKSFPLLEAKFMAGELPPACFLLYQAKNGKLCPKCERWNIEALRKKRRALDQG